MNLKGVGDGGGGGGGWRGEERCGGGGGGGVAQLFSLFVGIKTKAVGKSCVGHRLFVTAFGECGWVVLRNQQNTAETADDRLRSWTKMMMFVSK